MGAATLDQNDGNDAGADGSISMPRIGTVYRITICLPEKVNCYQLLVSLLAASHLLK